MNTKAYKDVDVVKCYISPVSPAMARHWLHISEKTGGNRKLSENLVGRYAAEMSAGHWRVTNNGIGINEAGNIIDGQHRLSAIVRSGQTVPMLVLVYKGTGTTALDMPLDIGKGRTLADITGKSTAVTCPVNFLAFTFIAHKQFCMPETVSMINDLGPEELAFLYDVKSYNRGFSSSSVSAALFAMYLSGKNLFPSWKAVRTGHPETEGEKYLWKKIQHSYLERHEFLAKELFWYTYQAFTDSALLPLNDDGKERISSAVRETVMKRFGNVLGI